MSLPTLAEKGFKHPDFGNWPVVIVDYHDDLATSSNLFILDRALKAFGMGHGGFVLKHWDYDVLLLTPIAERDQVARVAESLLEEIERNGVLSEEHYHELVDAQVKRNWTTAGIPARLALCQRAGVPLYYALQHDLDQIDMDLIELLQGIATGRD